MKSLKKKRRIQVVLLTFLALIMATALIGYGMRDGINFFRSPSELAGNPPPTASEVFRLGGLVKPGSIEPGEGVKFSFVVTDGGTDIPVKYVGQEPRPDLFDEGQGTIATGRYEEGVFLATALLAKHDEKYMPREVADALKEQGVYRGDGSPAAEKTDKPGS